MPSQHPADLHLDIDGRTVRVSEGQTCVVGRGVGCDVVVNNPEVSRRHAEFSRVGSTWVVRDLGSSNGTFLDGRRVSTDIALNGGNVIQLGGPAGSVVRVGLTPGIEAGTGYVTQATFAAPTPTEPPVSARPVPATAPIRVESVRAAATPAPAAPLQLSREAAEHEATSSTHFGTFDTGMERPVPPTAPVRLPKAPPRAPQERRPAGAVFDGFAGTAAAASPPVGEQTMVTGSAPQVVARSAKELTVGRGADNDVVVRDLLASRRHARLRPRGDGFEVEDLGSRNGTYINGSRIMRGFLGEDGILAIGRTRFTVRAGELVASQDQGDVNFVANHLSFTLPDGRKLLDDISFGLEGSSLVAVIGPSGAGKSTLLKALIGAQKATEGEVYYDGRDLYDNYDDLRHRIGVVPQDDVVHNQLTVRAALRYAAELRFPDDLEAEARNARVDEVIDELGLTQHADTVVSSLSGGQRKRTSVALELLTQPSLLFLDEPTSGLDPGLDKRVMELLRKLADDGGRTVVVITHNVASLGVCDRVLLLAPGGKVAFFGPPEEVLPYFGERGAKDYADVFNIVTDHKDEVQREFASSPLMSDHVSAPLSAPRLADPNERDEGPRQQSIPRQLSTLVRRQFKVMRSDRGFMTFMLLLPLVLAALAFITPGVKGLHTFDHAWEVQHDVGPGKKYGTPMAVPYYTSQQQIMVLLVIGAVFMGLALTIRELVAERPIFLREKAVGLSTFSYLASKVITYGALLAVQCAIMVGLVVATKGVPAHAVVLGSPVLEIFVLTFLTGLASIGFGLLLSSFAKTSEQVMPMLIISVMGALVFSGALYALGDAMKIPAVVFPSRWGLAMGAQTAGVSLAAPPPTSGHWDVYWVANHTKWLIGTGALLAQFVVTFSAAYVLTRRRRSM